MRKVCNQSSFLGYDDVWRLSGKYVSKFFNSGREYATASQNAKTSEPEYLRSGNNM